MKKFSLILIFAILSSAIFADEWLGWGYEGFNSSGTPWGWTQETVVGTTEWVTYGGIYTPYEGSGNIYFSTLVSVIGDETILVSEPFSNDGVSNSYFTFWHMQKEFAAGGGNNELRVYYRISPSDPWVLLEEYLNPIENWQEELIMLPATSPTIELGFKATLIGGEAYNPEGIALDLVSIKYSENNCPSPINLEISAITTTTATVVWQEVGSADTWDLEYGAYGFAPGSGTQINGINTTPEYTISSLTPGDQYDVYVRADCGSEQSDWIGPYSFYTDCNVITSFPYEETFDNSDFDDDDWNIGFHVNCWTEEFGQIANPTLFTGADADWSPREFSNPDDYNPTASNCASARAGFGNSWLLSPTFNIGSNNDFQLEFDVAATDYNGDAISFTDSDTLAIVISTDGIWNKSNIIKLWSANENPNEITPTAFHQVINLSAYTGNIEVAFYLSGASGSVLYIYIDNIKVKTFETTPLLEVLEPYEWNAGPLLINTSETSDEVFGIRNSGLGTLTINSITDLSSTEFTTNFNTAITLEEGEEYHFSFTYNPIDGTDDNVVFEIATDYGTGSIQLNGDVYVLDPCEVEIGIDNQEVNLPMNFFYDNSYSQFIYLQSEIDRVDESVNKVYFYYNGFEDYNSNERTITLYMKHTANNELAAWDDINTFTEVATEVILDFVDEGWYEIALDTEFPYNNTDNLEIAFYTEAPGMHMSQPSCYAHDAPNDWLMSMVTYSDGEIDINNPPSVSPVAKRPNIRLCLEESATAAFELLDPTEWVAGPQLINTTAESGEIFKIRNAGEGTLSINSITDLSATEFTTSFNTAITLDAGEEYSFSFEYTPVDLTDDAIDFVITTDFGSGTIQLSGTAYDNPQGIDETESNNSFSVYPNPADKNLELIFNKNSAANSIEIFDISGKIIQHNIIQNTKQQTIDISNLNTGIYFIKIGTSVQKFIKK